MLYQRGKKVEITAQLQSHAASKLAHWIGCFGVVWNCKVGEDEQARKTWSALGRPPEMRPKSNQAAAHFVDESRPWLGDVPSQIRRNAAAKWFEAKQAAIKGLRNHPRFRRPFGKKTCLITAELFEASLDNGVLCLGFKESEGSALFCKVSMPVGLGQASVPKSVVVSRVGRRFFCSWSYEYEAQVESEEVLLGRLALTPEESQDALVLGLDLGVAKPATLSDGKTYGFTPEQKRRVGKLDEKKRRYQKRMARCQKGSKNRRKTRERAARVQAKTKRIRKNFLHQTSKAIAERAPEVVVAENLQITNMVRRPKPVPVRDAQGEITGYEKNRAAQKAGLNAAILNVGWGELLTLLNYKLRERNKVLVKTAPHHSSQECSACGFVDAKNRPSQSAFLCIVCGYSDNADINAAKVLKKRFLNDLRSGTLPRKGIAAKRIAPRRKPKADTPTEVRCQPVEPSVRPESNLWQRPRSRKGRSARNACSRSAVSESESPIARSLPL